LSPEQLARLGQIYRLRGLITKAWGALIVLRVIARVLGRSPEKELRKLEEKISEMEETLARLRNQAEELRAQILAAHGTAVSTPTEIEEASLSLAPSPAEAGSPMPSVSASATQPPSA
jgi:hypothetical protein